MERVQQAKNKKIKISEEENSKKAEPSMSQSNIVKRYSNHLVGGISRLLSKLVSNDVTTRPIGIGEKIY